MTYSYQKLNPQKERKPKHLRVESQQRILILTHREIMKQRWERKNDLMVSLEQKKRINQGNASLLVLLHNSGISWSDWTFDRIRSAYNGIIVNSKTKCNLPRTKKQFQDRLVEYLQSIATNKVMNKDKT
jgi:hypothetical protein